LEVFAQLEHDPEGFIADGSHPSEVRVGENVDGFAGHLLRFDVLPRAGEHKSARLAPLCLGHQVLRSRMRLARSAELLSLIETALDPKRPRELRLLARQEVHFPGSTEELHRLADLTFRRRWVTSEHLDGSPPFTLESHRIDHASKIGEHLAALRRELTSQVELTEHRLQQSEVGEGVAFGRARASDGLEDLLGPRDPLCHCARPVDPWRASLAKVEGLLATVPGAPSVASRPGQSSPSSFE
jgi:hypothetical protein